jgi:hypothetical protein
VSFAVISGHSRPRNRVANVTDIHIFGGATLKSRMAGTSPAMTTSLGAGYSPIVRMTLLSGRVLFDDSLSSCESISSYFGTVVTSPFGTMCTTL